MKRLSLCLLCSLLPLLPSSQAREVPEQSDASTYAAVTEVLNPDGDFFLYLNARSTQRMLRERYPALKALMLADARAEGAAKERETRQILKGSEDVLRESGLGEIQALGASSVRLAERMYRSRIFLYHGPRGGRGRLWDLVAAKQTNAMTARKLLPTQTALAMIGDFDFSLAWAWLNQIVLTFGDDQARQEFQGGIALAKLRGLDLEKLIQSVDRPQGMALTLDETRMFSLPVNEISVKLPEPAALLFFKVKNDTVMKTIERLLRDQKVPFSTERLASDGVLYALPAMDLALPYPVILTIARHKQWLIVGSNTQIVKNAIACEQGRAKGLLTTKEFRSYTRELPTQANQFLYVAPSAPKYFIKAIEQTMIADEGQERTKSILRLLGLDGPAPYGAAVLQRRSDGLLISMNSNLRLSQTVLLSSVAVPAISAAAIQESAGVKATNLMERRDGGRKTNMRKLQQIGLAMMLYANDHQGKLPTTDGAAGLQQLVAKGILSKASAYLHPADQKRRMKGPLKTLTEERCSYVYIGAGFSDDDPHAAVTPIVFDKPGIGDGTTVLFIDGHVEFVEGDPGSRLGVVQILKKRLQIPEKRYQTLLKKARTLDQKSK